MMGMFSACLSLQIVSLISCRMAAILAQKIQGGSSSIILGRDPRDSLSAGMEKKRRDKETKFLATYKKETTETASPLVILR